MLHVKPALWDTFQPQACICCTKESTGSRKLSFRPEKGGSILHAVGGSQYSKANLRVLPAVQSYSLLLGHPFTVGSPAPAWGWRRSRAVVCSMMAKTGLPYWQAQHHYFSQGLFFFPLFPSLEVCCSIILVELTALSPEDATAVLFWSGPLSKRTWQTQRQTPMLCSCLGEGAGQKPRRLVQVPGLLVPIQKHILSLQAMHLKKRVAKID